MSIMQPKCSDALRLGSKDIPLVDKRGWQVKLCDPSLIRAILEHLRDEQVIIKRSTNKASFTVSLVRFQLTHCT